MDEIFFFFIFETHTPNFFLNYPDLLKYKILSSYININPCRLSFEDLKNSVSHPFRYVTKSIEIFNKYRYTLNKYYKLNVFLMFLGYLFGST